MYGIKLSEADAANAGVERARRLKGG